MNSSHYLFVLLLALTLSGCGWLSRDGDNCLDDDSCETAGTQSNTVPLGQAWYCYGITREQPWDCLNERDDSRIRIIADPAAPVDSLLAEAAEEAPPEEPSPESVEIPPEDTHPLEGDEEPLASTEDQAPLDESAGDLAKQLPEEARAVVFDDESLADGEDEIPLEETVEDVAKHLPEELQPFEPEEEPIAGIEGELPVDEAVEDLAKRLPEELETFETGEEAFADTVPENLTGYAVQLVALQTRDAAQAFADEHGIDQSDYVARALALGEAVYVVLLGYYDSWEEAASAADDWSQAHQAETEPWIRPVESLQNAIRAAREEP